MTLDLNFNSDAWRADELAKLEIRLLAAETAQAQAEILKLRDTITAGRKAASERVGGYVCV